MADLAKPGRRGVSPAGQEVSAYADLSFFRTGCTVGAVFAFQIGEPFPTDERTDLVRAMSRPLRLAPPSSA